MEEQLQFSFMRAYDRKYIPPDYMKFYSVYQYDRIKFKKLLRKEIQKLKPKNDEEFKEIQNKILLKCYIRDEKGKIKKDTDEKHIFRYKALDKILSKIYNLARKTGEQVGKDSDLLFFDDEQQAEIKGTWNLPVFERVKIHIRLLRELSKVDSSRL